MADALLLDIETAPNEVLAWGLWDQSLRPENILKERYILCASWKWLDGKQIRSASVVSHPGDERYPDRGVVEKLCGVISSAHVVIAHNGDKFDLRWIRGRALIMGLKPTPPVIQIDTLKMAKKQGYFNCNRLEYLASLLGVGEKEAPPFKAWKLAQRGDPKAIEQLVPYNRNDVMLLEGVYRKLGPWLPAKMNIALITNEHCCPFCGCKDLKPWSLYFTRAGRFKRYMCLAEKCGHWSYEPLTRGVIR